MKTSESISALAKSLAKAQGEIGAVKKSAQSGGTKFSYNYAKLEFLIEMAKPVLAKHGLCVIQMPTGSGDEVSITTRVLHESGEWIEDSISMPVIIPQTMNHAQAVGNVISYARRYSYASILSIAQEDDDAHSGDKPAKSFSGKCSEKQQQFIASLLTAKKIKFSELGDKYKVERLSDLGSKAAGEVITWLQGESIREIENVAASKPKAPVKPNAAVKAADQMDDIPF